MKNGVNKKSKLIWSVVSLIIAVASVWAVTSQNKAFSFSKFFDFAAEANIPLLIIAVLCMIGFIMFEAAALRSVCREFGHKKSLKDGFFYSAADIYFSAITPSATGGQPACAFFMIGDGIPGIFATVALIANVALYTLSIILIGIMCFIFKPGLLVNFNALSKTLIFIGFGMQAFLLLFFILLLTKKNLLYKICSSVLRFFKNIHILKESKAEALLEKLAKLMRDYAEYVFILKNKKRLIWKLVIYNFLQRFSQICVTVFTFLAFFGGSFSTAVNVWFLQSFVVLGTNSVPIPGAMGVTDLLMLDCFGSYLSNAEMATNLELFSRSLSFYCCIIICGIAVVIKYLIQRKHKLIRKEQ